MANPWKNHLNRQHLLAHYGDVAARVLAGDGDETDCESRITTLTDVSLLRQDVYRAVATEATVEGWDHSERYAALAILREFFDGNRVTVDHVTCGADMRYPGLTDVVGDIFDRTLDAYPDVARVHDLAGMHRHRRLQDAAQDAS